MEHMASHSLTRLYIVVSKSVTEETLEYMFGVFEGLEYVDLKRDHASGLSRVIISSKALLRSPLSPYGCCPYMALSFVQLSALNAVAHCHVWH